MKPYDIKDIAWSKLDYAYHHNVIKVFYNDKTKVIMKLFRLIIGMNRFNLRIQRYNTLSSISSEQQNI